MQWALHTRQVVEEVGEIRGCRGNNMKHEKYPSAAC